MPRFGTESERQLKTCHPNLQKILRIAIKFIDFKILEGFRNKRDQDRAYEQGFSKVKWPFGRHNSQPSNAVDVLPYPFRGYEKDRDRMFYLAGYLKATANQMGIPLRQGCDWDGDWNFNEGDSWDVPHIELPTGT